VWGHLVKVLVPVRLDMVHLGITLHLIETDVSQVQDTRHNPKDLALLLLAEVDHTQSLLHLLEAIRIVDARHTAIELGIGIQGLGLWF